eukprot:2205266-Ditylum_brightwellii.AAC.1
MEAHQPQQHRRDGNINTNEEDDTMSMSSTGTGYSHWNPSEKRRFLQLLQSGKSPVESSNLIKAARTQDSKTE